MVKKFFILKKLYYIYLLINHSYLNLFNMKTISTYKTETSNWVEVLIYNYKDIYEKIPSGSNIISINNYYDENKVLCKKVLYKIIINVDNSFK